MRHGSGHISIVINHVIAAKYRQDSSKGDSFSEVMEQKCWKQSSQAQTDALILCLDRWIMWKMHRPFRRVSCGSVFSGLLSQTLHAVTDT